MAAEKWATDEKKLENPMLRGYLVSKAHKNRIPVFRDDLFNGNNIHIVRCRLHTGNKYGGQNAEVVSVWQMLLTSQQRCKTVIVGFRGCGRHRS